MGFKDFLPRGCKDMLELEAARRTVQMDLKADSDFAGVTFCDVGARGIQIQGHHKRIKKCVFPISSITIKYDLSNIEECVVLFCRTWREKNALGAADSCNAMMDDYEKYGCD